MAVGSRAFIRSKANATDIDTLQTDVDAAEAEIDIVRASEPVTTIDGSTGQKACLVNGVTIVTGGTGIADLTLAAPVAGAKAIIRIGSISSGNVIVTCGSGVTLNGTNDIATFDAANEALMLVYKAANTWEIALNIGAVALSTSG